MANSKRDKIREMRSGCGCGCMVLQEVRRYLQAGRAESEGKTHEVMRSLWAWRVTWLARIVARLP